MLIMLGTQTCDGSRILALRVEDDSVCSWAASCVGVVVEASQNGEFLVWTRDGEAETLCIGLGMVQSS
jgi:hypothetical protein